MQQCVVRRSTLLWHTLTPSSARCRPISCGFLRPLVQSRPTRHLSDTAAADATVHLRGDNNYGSREYVLLPPDVSLEEATKDATLKLASLHANRNVLFGAKIYNNPQFSGGLVEACGPLVDAALTDAGQYAEQPQAMATLHGLCPWVASHLEDDNDAFAVIRNNDVMYQAVKAIATGVPRPGHSVVGAGTYRDGCEGWEVLAREFVLREPPEEVQLYQSRQGELVAIEHLADTSEAYLKSAGGAMARFFFL